MLVAGAPFGTSHPGTGECGDARSDGLPLCTGTPLGQNILSKY